MAANVALKIDAFMCCCTTNHLFYVMLNLELCMYCLVELGTMYVLSHTVYVKHLDLSSKLL